MDKLKGVRPELQEFVIRMEEVLRANEDKGGWSECDLAWLSAKLAEECGEVARLIAMIYRPDGKMKNKSALAMSELMWECVDVANVAMMLADQASLVREFDCEADADEHALTVSERLRYPPPGGIVR